MVYLPAADDWHYPLLSLFWTMLLLFVWILWFFLLFKILVDIFRSDDLGGWGEVGWMLILILIPFIGAFVYLIARGEGMSKRDVREAREDDEAARSYIRSTADTVSARAEELTKLADLRDRGVLSPQEFEAQKAKLLA